MTFDLLLGLRDIFRLGIHPSVYCYTSRNTFSMDAKMYSKMPTEKYSDGLGGQLFSETPQEKYDHVIFLQPKSRKKCRKNFENRFTNEIKMPKNYFEYAWEVIQAPKIEKQANLLNNFKSLVHSYAYNTILFWFDTF